MRRVHIPGTSTHLASLAWFAIVTVVYSIACKPPETGGTASDTTGASGTTTSTTGLDETTTGSPSCEHQEAGDTSPAGFEWKERCPAPPLALDLALAGDNGPVIQLWGGLNTGVVRVGDDEYVFDGSLDGVVAKFDPMGEPRWSGALRAHQPAGVGVLCGLPDGGVVLAIPARGSMEVGGATVDMDPSRQSLAVVALDAGGKARWNAVISGLGPGSTASPYSLLSARNGLFHLTLTASEAVSVGDQGPFDVDGFGGLQVTFQPDGAIRKVGIGPVGRGIALADDGSLLLDADGGIARTDASWEKTWIRDFDGLEYIQAGLITPKGEVVIAGNFFSEANFGGETFVNNEGFVAGVSRPDVFIGRYSADGEHLWSFSYDESRGVHGLATDASEGVTVVLADDLWNVWIQGLDPAGGSIGVLHNPEQAALRAVSVPGGAAILMGADVGHFFLSKYTL